MYSSRDVANEYKYGTSICQTLTSTKTGTAVDFQDCGIEVVSILSLGTIASTVSPEASVTVKLQESDDDSSYTDITSATHTAVDRDDDLGSEIILTARRTKRYVRAVATVAGASPSFPASVVLMAPKQSY